MKWHEVIVHKDVSRDCVKHVAMQHYHIAKWHDGKAGMPFRTTSIQDDPTWRTTQFNSLLSCWMLIARNSHELAAEVLVCHRTVLHILGYRKLAAYWIPHEISDVQKWHHYAVVRPCWSGTKGKVMTCLDESSLWMKHGLAHINQT